MPFWKAITRPFHSRRRASSSSSASQLSAQLSAELSKALQGLAKERQQALESLKQAVEAMLREACAESNKVLYGDKVFSLESHHRLQKRAENFRVYEQQVNRLQAVLEAFESGEERPIVDFFREVQSVFPEINLVQLAAESGREEWVRLLQSSSSEEPVRESNFELKPVEGRPLAERVAGVMAIEIVLKGLHIPKLYTPTYTPILHECNRMKMSLNVEVDPVSRERDSLSRLAQEVIDGVLGNIRPYPHNDDRELTKVFAFATLVVREAVKDKPETQREALVYASVFAGMVRRLCGHEVNEGNVPQMIIEAWDHYLGWRDVHAKSLLTLIDAPPPERPALLAKIENERTFRFIYSWVDLGDSYREVMATHAYPLGDERVLRRAEELTRLRLAEIKENETLKDRLFVERVYGVIAVEIFLNGLHTLTHTSLAHEFNRIYRTFPVIVEQNPSLIHEFNRIYMHLNIEDPVSVKRDSLSRLAQRVIEQALGDGRYPYPNKDWRELTKAFALARISVACALEEGLSEEETDRLVKAYVFAGEVRRGWSYNFLYQDICPSKFTAQIIHVWNNHIGPTNVHVESLLKVSQTPYLERPALMAKLEKEGTNSFELSWANLADAYVKMMGQLPYKVGDERILIEAEKQNPEQVTVMSSSPFTEEMPGLTETSKVHRVQFKEPGAWNVRIATAESLALQAGEVHPVYDSIRGGIADRGGSVLPVKWLPETGNTALEFKLESPGLYFIECWKNGVEPCFFSQAVYSRVERALKVSPPPSPPPPEPLPLAPFRIEQEQGTGTIVFRLEEERVARVNFYGESEIWEKPKLIADNRHAEQYKGYLREIRLFLGTDHSKALKKSILLSHWLMKESLWFGASLVMGGYLYDTKVEPSVTERYLTLFCQQAALYQLKQAVGVRETAAFIESEKGSFPEHWGAIFVLVHESPHKGVFLELMQTYVALTGERTTETTGKLMYQYMEAIFELRNPKQYRELKAALEGCFGEEESYYEWIAAIHSRWGADSTGLRETEEKVVEHLDKSRESFYEGQVQIGNALGQLRGQQALRASNLMKWCIESTEAFKKAGEAIEALYVERYTSIQAATSVQFQAIAQYQREVEAAEKKAKRKQVIGIIKELGGIAVGFAVTAIVGPTWFGAMRPLFQVAGKGALASGIGAGVAGRNPFKAAFQGALFAGVAHKAGSFLKTVESLKRLEEVREALVAMTTASLSTAINGGNLLKNIGIAGGAAWVANSIAPAPEYGDRRLTSSERFYQGRQTAIRGFVMGTTGSLLGNFELGQSLGAGALGAGQAIAQSGGEYGGERLTERSHKGTGRRLALTHSGKRDLERNSGAPRRLADSERPLPRRRLDGSSRLGITPRRSSNVFGVEGEGAYVDRNRLSIPSGAYRLTWGEKVLNFFVSPVYADEGVHGQTFLFDEESARHFIPLYKKFFVNQYSFNNAPVNQKPEFNFLEATKALKENKTIRQSNTTVISKFSENNRQNNKNLINNAKGGQSVTHQQAIAPHKINKKLTPEKRLELQKTLKRAGLTISADEFLRNPAAYTHKGKVPEASFLANIPLSGNTLQHLTNVGGSAGNSVVNNQKQRNNQDILRSQEPKFSSQPKNQNTIKNQRDQSVKAHNNGLNKVEELKYSEMRIIKARSEAERLKQGQGISSSDNVQRGNPRRKEAFTTLEESVRAYENHTTQPIIKLDKLQASSQSINPSITKKELVASVNDSQAKLKELRNYLGINEPRTTVGIVDDIFHLKYRAMDTQANARQMQEWRPLESIYKSKTVSTRKERDSKGRESYKDTPSGKYSKPAWERMDETRKQKIQVDGKLKSGYSKELFLHNDSATETWEGKNGSIRVGQDPYAYGNVKANLVTYTKGAEIQANVGGGVGINLATTQANTKYGDLQIDIDGPNVHAKAVFNVGVNPVSGKKIEVRLDVNAAVATIKGEETTRSFQIGSTRYKCNIKEEVNLLAAGISLGFGYENHRTKNNSGSFNVKVGGAAEYGVTINANCDFEDVVEINETQNMLNGLKR